MKHIAVHSRPLAWVASLLSLVALGACSDDGTAASACNLDDKVDRGAKFSIRDWLQAEAKPQYLVDISTLGAGKSRDFVLSLTNTADANLAKPLVFASVTVQELDEKGDAVTSPQFGCLGPDGQACDKAVWPALIPAGFEAACAPTGASSTAQTVTLRYTRPADAKQRRIKLTFSVVGDPAYTQGPRTLELTVQAGAPKLSCKPDTIDFGQVAAGTPPPPQTLTCTNKGNASAAITGLELKGKTWLGDVTLGTHKVTLTAPWLPEDATSAVEVAAGTAVELTVALDPGTSTQKQSATLLVKTTDPAAAEIQVPMYANTTGPCLTLSPPSVEMGDVAITQKGSQTVTLSNCGVDDVEVSAIAFAAGATAGLTVGAVVGLCGDKLPATGAPWILPPKQACSVTVEFAPPGAGVEASGNVEIVSTAGTKSLPVTAKGVAVSCGSACFTIKNAANSMLIKDGVTPQTKLNLDGACSTAAPGQSVGTWKWSLQSAPQGNYASFLPSPIGQKVTFTPVIAGTYQIKLETIDGAGAPGCQPKIFNLLVIPDDKLHIELTWTTVGDKIPTDELGTDLDLHLARPVGVAAKLPDLDGNGEPDPWGSQCDCFAWHKLAKWDDPMNDDDDARLDLDDFDGWGPEIINVRVPIKGQKYQIGVRDWFDKPTDKNGVPLKDPVTAKPYPSFGVNVPRVRVYLDASQTPALDTTGPEMIAGDMWCVRVVSWSPNTLVPCTGADSQGVLLTPSYPVYQTEPPACQ